MHLISQRDFETEAGHKKIVAVIHSLQHKVQELEHMVHEISKKENLLEQDLQGYEAYKK